MPQAPTICEVRDGQGLELAIIDQQRIVLADLLGTLAPDEWNTPSLCEHWTVREVAAHLSMAATARTNEVLRYVIRARGNFDRMIHDSAVNRAAQRSNAQIATDLRGILSSRKLAPGTFRRDPLVDIPVHGQDIARPLGRTVKPPTEASRVAASGPGSGQSPSSPPGASKGSA